MARPRKDSNAIPTEERILAAAELAFGECQYADANLANIAASAGIRRPSLLYHFGTKEALYGAVVLRSFSALAESMTHLMHQPGTFEERLEGLMAGYLDYLATRPAFSGLVLRGLMDRREPVPSILETGLVPVLDLVENWIRTEGSEVVSKDTDVRSAILQLTATALVRDSAGPIALAMWGPNPDTMGLLRRLFFQTV
ncbi:MAG: TetR/AcrR family transcriptional regulator [Myxococcota bacterium]|nr:TetR/AcrR family transcriptional regulator [Myxococcota bacterium]